MARIKIDWRELWSCCEEFEVSEDELNAIRAGELPEQIFWHLKEAASAYDDEWSFEEVYSPEEKQIIESWIYDLGAEGLNGFEEGYEYKHGQMLQAAKDGMDAFDYDRWQTLQNLCKMEIPLELDQKLESIFYVNDIETFELKSDEEA